MISSKYIEAAVNAFASLQGVGRKTALRYVLEMIGREEHEVERFAMSLTELKAHIKHCKNCHNISDAELCEICKNPSRDTSTLCIVEDIRDVMAIESTHQYKGLYHVLGGKISPMDGIGPSDLHIGTLVDRLNDVREVILALSPTMEGDTTAYFLYKKLETYPALEVSTLSRGVAVGDELQYADEITLGRSIIHRTPYEKALR